MILTQKLDDFVNGSKKIKQSEQRFQSKTYSNVCTRIKTCNKYLENLSNKKWDNFVVNVTKNNMASFISKNKQILK